ncbi:kinase-like domain-containing protein [Pisolithus marmoratus]|nr:kinase-like domain-containing protein [Pisolithus marmoratus]
MEDPRFVLRKCSERASRYGISLDGRVCKSAGANLRGAYAIVYEGALTPDGTKVAIKTPRRPPPGDTATLKRILSEVHLRSKLRHENIVPLLGISTEFDLTISVISEWMPLGNAHDYVQDTANDPRPLLEDIASGLCYLHTNPSGAIFHGDLRGSNVLVSGDRRARLTDFGVSYLVNSTFSISGSGTCSTAFRWMAPELLEGDGDCTSASDVWAFGMTILELFTREIPFHRSRGALATMMIVTGRLPPCPAEESTQFRLTDAWWEPPTAPQLSSPVEQESYLPDTTHLQQATDLSSVLHELCNRASTYAVVLNGRISRNPGTYPLRGGTAVVHQGTLAPEGTKVAIKTFHSTQSGTETDLKRIFREVHIWSMLRHENIVPMFGITTESNSTISIISEWMSWGNAYMYVQDTENDPRPLVNDIANGLRYLHNYTAPPGPIVHGDLKGLNVVVSSDRRALLTDFGLSILNASTIVDAIHGFSFHWAAPELLGERRASRASDVWAFGMTILELFTRAVPFPKCRNRVNVLNKLTKGKLPPRPAKESHLTDAWWEICTSCWGHDPSSRPTMNDIIERVKVAISQAKPGLTGPEASSSLCPISKQGESHPTVENPEVARSHTATDRASESIPWMKTAPEYPGSTAGTSKPPASTVFWTCPGSQPSLTSDLNDKYAQIAPDTADVSGSVNLERNYVVEDNSWPRGSVKTSQAAEFSPSFESQVSPSGLTSVVSKGADILEENTKDIMVECHVL